MSSKTPTSCFLIEERKNWDDDDMDTNRLLRIFPEETWKVILEKVKDLKSLENLSLASLFFRERLASRRLTFLFPGVFECILKRHEQDPLAFPTHTTNSEADTYQDIKNKVWEFPWRLRLVCKDWNKIIEDYFQKPKINYFIKSLRCLNISARDNLDLTHMLAKFGQTLKFVKLNFYVFGGGYLVEYYLLIKKFFNYLPSLQELEIRMDTGDNSYTQGYKLVETIKKNPCSVLKELESLSVNLIPSQILREIVRSNSGLKRLKLFVHEGERHTFDFSMPLPNLNSLEVFMSLDEDFQRLKRFAKNWRLTSFCGMFRGFTEKTTWLEIYKMIGENWGDTLEQLCLQFPTIGIFCPLAAASASEMILQFTTDQRLEKLKMLKRVEIYTGSAISLDFLLTCQDTIEKMRIDQYGNNKSNLLHQHYNDVMGRQIVKYLGTETEMQNSNVWDLFPKLKIYKSLKTEVKRPA